MADFYLTITAASEGLFKDKGSRFLAFAYPVESEDEIKEHIQSLKKLHHSARHHCFAWNLGVSGEHFRINDDGEPSYTAGKPIFGQIRHFNLTNILIVVVRYFGGTLLGVSGLINAYGKAAANAIQNATIVEKLVETTFWVEFSYLQMNSVMKLFKDKNLPQKITEFDLVCRIQTSIRESEAESIIELFNEIPDVRLRFQV